MICETNIVKKNNTEWKTLLSSTNTALINAMMVFVGFFNSICFMIVSLKQLAIKNTNISNSFFPSYNVCVVLIMLTCCYVAFFRLFYNRTSPRFSKTLPCSKKLYTVKLSFLFECIITTVLIFTIAGTFFCYHRGYNSPMFYLLIIFFLFIHFSVSLFYPITVRFFNGEQHIYWFNLKGKISSQAIFIFSFFVLNILPSILLNYFAKPLCDFFGPLSLQGLTTISIISLFVIIVSSTLNKLMFTYSYRFL